MKSAAGTAGAGVFLAVLSTLTYLLFLGSDLKRDRHPVTGNLTGPWGAPQVLACSVVLLALAVAAARRGPGWLVFVVPAVFTVCWSVPAATDPNGDGLWPIGTALVAVSTMAVAAGVLLGTRRPRPAQEGAAVR